MADAVRRVCGGVADTHAGILASAIACVPAAHTLQASNRRSAIHDRPTPFSAYCHPSPCPERCTEAHPMADAVRRVCGGVADTHAGILASAIACVPAAHTLQAIAIHRKPHTVLRRLAVQKRTVFGDAPCLKLSVDGYSNRRSAIHGRRQKNVGHKCPTYSGFCLLQRTAV